MNDRELLELAAIANGERIDDWNGDYPVIYFWDGDPENPERNWRMWNPLTDDGDALRLAVTLRLAINVLETDVRVVTPFGMHCVVETLYNGDDPYAATRRAIVRAAAEIGKAMQ